MRICHVSATLQAGSGTVISDWIAGQIADGHTIAVVYSPVRDELEQLRRVFPAAVEFHPLNMSREVSLSGDVAAMRGLNSLLKVIKPDILHLHSSKAGLIGRVAGRLRGIPTFYSPHGLAFLRTDVSPLSRTVYFLAEWLSGIWGGTTVACSQTELDYLKWVPGRKCLIPNGVRLADFENREKLPRHDGTFRVVLSGRLSPQKNPLLACAVAKACPDDWQWQWIGDGELRIAVEQAAGVQILGWMDRDKALAKMESADVFVHTSQWEGMPMVILEAMALGLPVVASNVVGNRDLVVPGVTGFLVKSVGDYESALSVLAASPALREKQGRAATRRINDEFSQEKLVHRWLDLYRAAL